MKLQSYDNSIYRNRYITNGEIVGIRYRQFWLSVKAGMGNRGMEWEECRNEGNQDGNAGNQGWNVGNQGGNAGNQGRNVGNQVGNAGNQGGNAGNGVGNVANVGNAGNGVGMLGMWEMWVIRLECRESGWKCGEFYYYYSFISVWLYKWYIK